jgi:hypothetical protein
MKHLIKTRVAIMLLLSTMATASCTVVGTLNPIYDSEKSFVVNDGLSGKWTDAEDKKGYIFIEKANELKEYKISVTDIDDDEKEETHYFIGHLINDKGLYFLEYWYDLDDNLKAFAVVRHFIAKINFTSKNKLEVDFIDGEKLVKLIDQKKLQLIYAKEKADKDNFSYLILDKSPGLQKAVADLKKYPEVFSDKATLIRSE